MPAFIAMGIINICARLGNAAAAVGTIPSVSKGNRNSLFKLP